MHRAIRATSPRSTRSSPHRVLLRCRADDRADGPIRRLPREPARFGVVQPAVRMGGIEAGGLDFDRYARQGAVERRARIPRPELSASITPDELEFEALWRNYMLLETFDYLSLLTCFGFESSNCGPVPTLEGRWEQLAVRRLGPSDVELDPFPFAGDRLEVDVECVHLEQPDFRIRRRDLRDPSSARRHRRFSPNRTPRPGSE